MSPEGLERGGELIKDKYAEKSFNFLISDYFEISTFSKGV